MADVKVLILRESGTNCEEETANAFKILGASVRILHMNVLWRGRESIENYQILVIPGGFSHGDAVSAAVIWAKELKYRLKKDLVRFIEQGKLVLGICNGFQVLVKAGLLPAFQKVIEPQSVTLAFNHIGIYFDTWVYLKPNPNNMSAFTQGLDHLLYLPVAHAEGRFTTDERTLSKLEDRNQIVFRYADPDGRIAGFPWNPNGSLAGVAGICNPWGNVLGLMPHPERYIHRYMHPLWTSRRF
ncbi:MAG: phosphoribosylformylglycinamidine synthase I, partial [Candidatus Bathyarchaeia archaeon]